MDINTTDFIFSCREKSFFTESLVKSATIIIVGPDDQFTMTLITIMKRVEMTSLENHCLSPNLQACGRPIKVELPLLNGR